METHYVQNADLLQTLGGPRGKRMIGPAPTPALAWLVSMQDSASLDGLTQPRAAQSPKSLFLPPSESVSTYGPRASPTATETQPLVMLGVRACELRARNYLDKVLAGGEFHDPAYRRRREAITIVSCDCADCAESCFCTLVGGQPFATEGFDVNLTPVDGGFVAEVATDKGRQWLGQIASTPAAPAQLAAREKLRKEMTARLHKQNAAYATSAFESVPAKLPEGDDEGWQTFAADCVECGACTHICPTCHCFYLYDQAAGEDRFERVRTWDSCLLSTYHRMAGTFGMKPTPRPRLSSRLANRVLHKFVYSLRQYELPGCVGCGRCVDACLGAIDIRRVVRDLSA